MVRHKPAPVDTKNRPFRSPKTLARTAPSRDGKRVLILCEGEKTEPAYFRALQKLWRLPGTRVVIESPGSAPITIVDAAIEHSRRAKADKTPFDKVFCVFDRDGHESFQRAVDKAQAHGFIVAASVVSFEFWFLLHFTYTTASFGTGNRVIAALRQHLPNYTKADFADTLLDRLDKAIANAEKLRSFHNSTASAPYTEPWTDVDRVVLHLRQLKVAG